MAKPFPKAEHWTARAEGRHFALARVQLAVVGCLESQTRETPRVAPPAVLGPGLIRSLTVGRESFGLPGWDLARATVLESHSARPFPGGQSPQRASAAHP